jgi:hypothetical protein
MRRSWVYIDGVAYEKGTEPNQSSVGTGPAIVPDSPDFISPIDRTVVRGRAGIRDHCARHNVVQTAELKGLPMGIQPSVPDRKAIRRTIIDVINSKGYSDAG